MSFNLEICLWRSALLRGISVALIAMLAPSVLMQYQPSVEGAEPTVKTVRPTNASGIAKVSRTRPALLVPGGDDSGQILRYGLGLVFQVGPRTAAVSCNVRTVGEGHWDFENGSDVVVFDNLATISQQKPVVVARNEEDRNPSTGKKRVAVTYPVQVGFVPLGAKRSDGSAHPEAGTGFGFSHALCFDLNDNGYFTWEQASIEHWYVHQFAYDGQTFRVVKSEKKPANVPLKTIDDAWAIKAPGLSAAIADGDDLLLAVSANDGKREAAGISRWRRSDGDWRPVSFYPISSGMEPSLVRDGDGGLLYSVRGSDEDGEAVRVWRASDNEQNWTQIFYDRNLRSNAPVVLNQAADGTPYIAANHPDSFRAKLCLWPLNTQRNSCESPIVGRECVDEFGQAPEDTTWFADHPMATTVQLADGQWHHLLGYRIMAFSTKGVGGEKLTPQTGCYVEEVFSTGSARPAWKF